MRFISVIGCALCAMAVTLSASTIDVSSQNFQTLQTGNTLIFVFSDASYSKEAAQLDISPYPAQIDFSFDSALPAASGDFTANLETLDGSVSVAFPGEISWASGYASLSRYAGPVSALDGLLNLSPTASQAIFEGGYAQLILTYSGDPVTVGLSGYTLPHAMSVSLGGGPVSIGGVVYNAYFDPPSPDAITASPEPGSQWLLCGGGAFCLLAAGLKRWARRRAWRRL